MSKDCGDEDLKKAYKKLALKFHPDKNHAPGATEAFKGKLKSCYHTTMLQPFTQVYRLWSQTSERKAWHTVEALSYLKPQVT